MFLSNTQISVLEYFISIKSFFTMSWSPLNLLSKFNTCTTLGKGKWQHLCMWKEFGYEHKILLA